MSDHKPEPKPTLDDLLSIEPILSDPLTVKLGGTEAQITFKEVSHDTKNRLKAAAIQHIENDRRKREEEGGHEWREVSMDLDVLRAEEQELRVLQAAMKDPKTKAPAFSLEVMRYHLSSNLQEFLGQKYAEFESGLNPDSVSEEMIENLIDDVKKNVDLALLWTLYGSLTALRCVQVLVAQLETYQTESSGGT